MVHTQDGDYPRVDRTAAGSSEGWEPGLSRNVNRPINNTPEISQAQPTAHLFWQKDNMPIRNTTVPTSPAMPVPKELIALALCLYRSSARAKRSCIGRREAGSRASVPPILDASVLGMQPSPTDTTYYRQAK